MAVDGRGRAGGTSRWQGRSEVRLLLCNGRNGPIALEFGVTVINRHRPWACPKRAPHFQVGAGDHQLAESLHGWRGEELSEKSGCWGPRGACLSDTSEGGGAWKQQAGLAALPWAMRRPGDLFPAPTPGHGDDRVPALGEEGEDEQSCLPCTWPAAGDQDAGAIPRPHPSFLGRLRMGSESLLGLATCGASHLTPLSHAVPPVRWASCSSCRLCCEGELHHLQGHLYSGLCINGYVSHRRPLSCPSSPSRE